MAKRQSKKPQQNIDVGALQPDELNALKALALEFVNKVESIDNEIDLLEQDKKDLQEEYAEKLDVKTLKQALAYLKLRNTVAHKDTFDAFVAALEKE